MIVAEDNEAVGGAAAQAADIAQSAGANIRNGRRPGDAPEGTVFMSRTKSFTRRSRELPPNLARTWDAHAERYVIEPRRGIGYTTVAEDFRLDPVELFGRSAPLIWRSARERANRSLLRLLLIPIVIILRSKCGFPGLPSWFQRL